MTLGEKAAAKLMAFTVVIEECAELLTTLSLPDFYEEVMLRTGYLKMLEEKDDIEARTRAENVRELLEYPADTAGAIMNPHVATLDDQLTVDEAIGEVRRMRDEYENIYYLYVVDSGDILEGVVSMRALMLAPKGAKVRDIMATNLIGLLSPSMDKEIVAHIMADTDYHTLPVVGENGELLGYTNDNYTGRSKP